MLNYNEFLPLAPESGSIRVNHSSSYCSGSSASMQITVLDDGTVLAYCHRCGQKGRYSDHSYKGAKERLSKELASVGVYLPIDSTTEVAQWPSQAAVWLYKAGLSDQQILNQLRPVYSPSIRRVIIPYYKGEELIGYQARKIFTEDDGPKYYKKCNKVDTLYASYNYYNTDVVVVTEDILSAIRVSKFTNSYSILGTSLQEVQKKELIKNYNKFIVWLDNDNPTVIRKVNVLRNTLQLFGWVTVIRDEVEPKHMSNEELHKFLISKGIV